jgi:hypothetical protein
VKGILHNVERLRVLTDAQEKLEKNIGWRAADTPLILKQF